jgi:hypothetical protein
VRAYRVAFAIAGTMIAAVSAAVPMAYLALVALPVSAAFGYAALWVLQGSRDARGPVAAGGAAALVLIALAVFYSMNGGNWNQPGTQSLLLPLLAATMLLAANVFAVYVRFVAGRTASLAGGPALVAIAAVMFWWLLHVDAGRADLYLYRLTAVFASLSAAVTALVIADRQWLAAKQKGRV